MCGFEGMYHKPQKLNKEINKYLKCASGSVVEYRLAKARVAGSNPVSCFFCCLFTHLTYIQIKILKTEMLHYYSTATSPFFHLPIISYLVNEMINF